jgi:HSP90 family molecular chaperone
MPQTKTIKVTVDKSHLLTLGERMYVESIELIRELVNNAYDADATEVYVTVTPESIVIEDDGSGMNEKGLAQFFTVGSEEKRICSVSPRFGRKRIGQFGIGKFAALAAADKFVVESRKGDWIYSVIFDREEWQKSESWELPISREPATPLHHEGTKVTLTKLKKQFSQADVERYLKESVPLRAKKFVVYLNGKRITARYIPGRRFSISVKTMYGPIEGEIIIAVKSDLVDKPGIECRVKQVLIRREFFDLEKTHAFGLNRLAGEVNVDFLPVSANRDDFIRDTPEFKLFYQIMRTHLEKILKELKKESEIKNLKKVSAELKEILGKIRAALQLHPELMPSGRAIAARRKRKGELAAGVRVRVEKPEEVAERAGVVEKERIKEGEREKAPEIVLPKPEVIKRIKLKQLGVSVALVSLGEDGQEIISQGNLIYINRDHPLYKKLSSRKEQFELHLLRLITQEIVLMKKQRIAGREAFEWQSKLLADALCGSRAHQRENPIDERMS